MLAAVEPAERELDLRLEHVTRRLAAYRASVHTPLVSPKRAAVAVVLRYSRADAPEVLLMRRVERKGDRWSGHVSFPGGREEEHDPDLQATAMRETREEVGLDLASGARLVGRLDDLRAVAKGKLLPLSISPFVFHLERDAPLVLNEEAADAFWLPLDRAAAGDLDDRIDYGLGPARLELPCWRYEGHVVWGLTFRMLERFLALLR